MSLILLASKIFATRRVFTDHLKHKTKKKTTYLTPSVNPHQLCVH